MLPMFYPPDSGLAGEEILETPHCNSPFGAASLPCWGSAGISVTFWPQSWWVNTVGPSDQWPAIGRPGFWTLGPASPVWVRHWRAMKKEKTNFKTGRLFQLQENVRPK